MGEDADDRVIAGLEGVIVTSRNTAHWYNNASFLLPMAATILVGAAGLLRRSADLLGFAAFLAIVTVGMVPVVLWSWRQTPTSVVLTQSAIVTVHKGAELKALHWSDVTAITLRETQGNQRWEVASANGERILLDGELEHLGLLVQQAKALAGLRENGRA